MAHRRYLTSGAVGLALIAASWAPAAAWGDPASSPDPSSSASSEGSATSSAAEGSDPSTAVGTPLPDSADSAAPPPSEDPLDVSASPTPSGVSDDPTLDPGFAGTPAPDLSDGPRLESGAPAPVVPSAAGTGTDAPSVAPVANVDAWIGAYVRAAGCTAPADGIQILVTRDSGADPTVYQFTGDQAAVRVDTIQPGSYRVQAVCTTGTGSGAVAAGPASDAVPFQVYSRSAILSAEQWEPGQNLSVAADGYNAGETVRATVVSRANGQTTWQTTLVASALGSAHRSLFDLSLPSRPGSYTLSLYGMQTGYVRTAYFQVASSGQGSTVSLSAWQRPQRSGRGEPTVLPGTGR